MTIERWKNELNALVNRGMDRHLRLAVTGLSRSGKTAFITAMVNQLLNVHAGARLPLFSAVREERLLGVKRVPQRDLVFRVLPMTKGLHSSMVRHPSGQPRHAVSARFDSRCASGRWSRCCAILKRPPRCIWKLSIIQGNGCWICRCWLRII